MVYVDLQLAKRHLNVEESFVEDDEYIGGLIEAAEAVVEKDVCDKLDTLAQENGGKLPAPLRQCILLMVGQFYANREPVAFAQSAEVPLSYSHLVSLYRNYAK
ncbi:head-tail connector protein [uncultured Bacteroides sp.]|uniref:head-tail connector protein n=1 Tax=uncultured Bacteroides sp. TaxID=162156 RepID=UPI0020501B8C|nr:head-tail connector protein [uncultured Bacteroides sp.]DAJ86853.1 MAG TPA: Head Tail Connector Protein [Caudoviricetes sp.]